MKRLLKEEQGYALLIAMAVILLFTVLGISLMTLTSNGMVRSEHREDKVQAQDISDKGIDFVVNDVQKKLEDQIKSMPMGKTAFEQFLMKTLGEIKDTTFPDLTCSSSTGGVNIPGENGSVTKVCIEKTEKITTDEKDRYRRIVTFKSTGIVNGREFTTFTKVMIGTDAIPDQLRYAVSTNDGGNLFLHGGVEIKGDIKASGNVIISDHASWGTAAGTTNTWTPSITAKIIKDDKSATPKLILPAYDGKIPEKKVYKFNLIKKYNKDNTTTTYFKNKLITASDLNDDKDSYTEMSPANESDIANTFFDTPNLKVVTKTLASDQVEIENKVDNIMVSSNRVEQKDSINITNTNNSSYIDKNKIYYVAKKCNWNCETKYTNANMEIKGYNSNIDVTLKGTFYVSGNVIIDKVNLKSDAILYVKGNVTIDSSTLKGADNGTLIIFAQGNVTIANISSGSDESKPSDIKGFFYSKSNMHLIGVLSNIKLTGGVSADRLILSGLRGSGNSSRFNNPTEQRSKQARLRIIYDENLIKSFTSFKRDEEEEFITVINDPEILERY